MTKSTQSRRTPATTVQQSKTNPRTASKKSTATVVAKKEPPALPRKAGTQPTSKIEAVIALLRRPKGANIKDLMEATGWQAHSVRGAISGAIKKKLGLNVMSEKTGTVRLYRIANRTSG